MKMPLRPLLLLLCLPLGSLPAQVAAPSPLTAETAAARTVPGGWIVAEGRADRALQAGFPTTAAAIYREALADRSAPAELRQRLSLSLVTALLDAGELGEAEQALRAYDGPQGSAYHLRAGLLSITAGRTPQARAALAASQVEELPATDRGWWHYLQALVAEAENDTARRDQAYEKAMEAAVSELQKATFRLRQEQALLRQAPPDEARLNNMRKTMEDYQGRTTGYDYARYYAAALAGLGRSAEAQMVLNRQLALVPASERNVADQLALMLGLIAGEGSAAGRQAFRQLLRSAQRPETQRLALQLLVRGAKTSAERDELRRELSDLIGAPVTHPIIEELLLVRAQTALTDKNYAAAEEDARALLDRYPTTTLRAPALGVRLAVAWDLKRYRTAADVIAQLRTVISPGRERAELGVLMAEAFFRAEDFRNAADAYDAALHEAPLAAPAGILIFQRVLAEIRADRLEAAARQLDDASADATFDPVNRWQAEWNLVREMQVRGQAQAAYARIERLLAAGTQGVPEDLRIRLMWLRAKLSFDNGQPQDGLRQADELLAMLGQTKQLEAELLTNATSTTRLLKAQTLLALGRDAEGYGVLDLLRKDFGATPAAQYSYLVQAGHLTQTGDLAAAQRVLISFVDNREYRQSEYAPLALYQAALLLDRQGLDRHLREAYNLLERLVHDYPRDELVFYSRLKQGDLMRKLNDFGTARQLYEDLVYNSSQHPDILLAHLALADTLAAQGANSIVNYESASAIYERLRDLPSAPSDLRVEAGFKWGYALAKRSQPAKAQAVLWSVVEGFLLEPAQAAQLGAKGRYWMSRSLLELGQIHEDAGHLDEAQRAYQWIIDNKLGGATQAQAKLARFRTGGGKTP